MKRISACLVAAFLVLGFLHQNSYSATRAVTDNVGRLVEAPENPVRVVTLAPSLAEVVFALGQGWRLVGVTRFSNYPPEARNLPRVGSYVHLDIERIMALKPDLCLAIKDGNPIAVIRRLEGLGVPVFAVSPQNLGEVIRMLLDIGDLLDALSQARELVGDMKKRIEAVRTTVSKAENKPTVFFQIGVSPIVSVGEGTFIDELIHLAGGVNLTRGKTTYPRLTREEVIALSPDIFIITSMAREETFQNVKSQWSRWPSIPAVKNDRLHLVDSDIVDRPTPRLVDGLEILSGLFHPELFKGVR